MTLLDSSAWIEHFAGGALAGQVAPYLRQPSQLLLPSIVLYEVYKKIKGARGEELALTCVAQMAQGRQVPLDDAVALHAADLSLAHRLPMADAIVYATARFYQAKLVTLDRDFQGLADVVVLALKS